MPSYRLPLALALALLAPLAMAQRRGQAELLELSLDELLRIKVVSASFRPSNLREASASVTIFERTDLEKLGLRNLHEVLAWVPGAYSSRVAATGLENRTVLRGNPGTGGGGLLAIDGQRVNTMQTARAWGVVRNFPLALVERVEVIRGPGAARFGGGPSDEVVHVVTRRNDGRIEASVTAEGGQAAQVLLGETLGAWRFDLRASETEDVSPRYENLFDRYGRVDASTETGRTRTALLDVTRGDHSVQVFHHASDSRGYYGLIGSINPGDESLLEATWWRYAGRFNLGGWTMDAAASESRQRYRLGGVAQPGGSPPFVAGDLRQRGVLTHRGTAGSLVLQRRFGAHTLTFGAETQVGRTTQADLQANYTVGPVVVPLGGFASTGLRFVAEGARDRQCAAFAEHDWQITPSQRWVMGLRFDRSQRSGSSNSPRLAWVWTPGERTSVKLLYQEAFFTPTLGQLFLQNNRVIAGAPDLRPTRVATTELVVRYDNPRFRLTGTLYHRDARDGFIVVPRHGVNTTTINAMKQHSEGLEGAFAWMLSPTLRMRLTASTLFNDHYTLPANIAEAPPGLFVSRRTASLQWHWTPDAHWELATGATWRSREGFQTRTNDPRALLQVNWRRDETLRLWLHVDNLFNARGSDVDSGGGLGLDPSTGQIVRTLPLPGREVQLGLGWAWR